MSDDRYEEPVAGLGPDDLSRALRDSIRKVMGEFPPQTGVCVFVFDFGAPTDPQHGFAYISNAQRPDMLKALREFMNREASLS